MDSTLPDLPKSQIAGAGRRLWIGLQAVVDLILFLLIWLSVLDFPRSIAAADVDLSWRAAYGFFFKNGLRAGADYVFTYGPLGYFMSALYDSDLFWAKYIWELVGKFLLAITLFGSTRHFPFLLRSATLLLIVLFARPVFVNADVGYEYVALVTLLALSAPRSGASAASLWLRILALTILTQIKFTLLVFIGPALLWIGITWIFARQYFRAAHLLTAFTVCFAGTWTLLGQSLGDLPAYLTGSFRIAAGFDAMGIVGDPSEIGLFCSIVALLAGLLLFYPISRLFTLHHLNAAAVIGLCLFLQWKHGFVRHDGGHVILAFAMLALICPAFPAFFPGCDWQRPARVATLACASSAAIAGILLTTCKSYDPVGLATAAYDHAGQNLSRLVDPALWRRQLEDEQANQAVQCALPEIRSRVGDAPVDMVSYEQGVVLLNRLNYRPRPVFQSYHAYSSTLMARNAEFFRGPAAPPFLVFKLETIDNRFPLLDDSLALFEIFRRYQPLLAEKGYLLLQKTDSPPHHEPAPQLLRKAVIQLNEEVVLGDLGCTPLRVSLDVRCTGQGKFWKFLHRAPLLFLRVRTTDNAVYTYRFIPAMARDGFLLSPLLLNTLDVARLYGNVPLPRVISCCLLADAEGLGCYKSKVTMTVERVPYMVGHPLEAAALCRLCYPMFDSYPLEAQSCFVKPGEVEGTPVLVVHAEGLLRFEVPAAATDLTARFGIMPGAYEDGHTDGVQFVVEYRPQRGQPQILFQRHLDPVNELKDRGLQALRVPLTGLGKGELLL
jgi:hypothetical protein